MKKKNEKEMEKKNENQNSSTSSFSQPTKIPGKLKIPELFLSIKKDNPKIQKKENKPQVEENKIDIQKEEEKKSKENAKPTEETKTPINEASNNKIKKSYTTKEIEIKKQISKPLPTIEENDNSKVNKEFNELGRKTLQLQSINLLNEVFLEPTTYGQFLREEKNRGVKHPYRETFCEGFFIASFPQKDGKVIEMSQSFP